MVLAVTVAGIISGCCMKRDIVIVDDKINKIRHDQRIMKEDIARLDSLLTSETDASLKLRAQFRQRADGVVSNDAG
jgi:hypothetical protein